MGRAAQPAFAHRRHAGGKLHLAGPPQLYRPGPAIHHAAFDIDRRSHVVTGRAVRLEFIDQIAAVVRMPEMVMRIDDRQFRLKHRPLDREHLSVHDVSSESPK